MPPFPTPIIMLPLSRLRHGSLGISGAVGGSLPASPSTSGAFLNQQPSGRSDKFSYLQTFFERIN